MYSATHYVRNLINIGAANRRISRIDALVFGSIYGDLLGINWFWDSPFQKAQRVGPQFKDDLRKNR